MESRNSILRSSSAARNSVQTRARKTMAVLNNVSVLAIGAVLLFLLVRPLVLPGKQIRRHGARLRKAPNTLPLVGNGILFMQAREKLFSWFVKCERLADYETLELSVPTLPPGVLVNDPKNLDFIFKNEALFSKGRFVKSRAWDLFGHGIINADGDMWRAQRKAGAAFLSTANLRVLTDVALPQFLSESVDYLRARADARTVVDLQQVFHEITTQLMGKVAYNMEMHTDDPFASAFDHASGATAERFQNPLWPVTELVLGSRFRASVATVKAFGHKIVANAIADRHNRPPPPPPSPTDDDTSSSTAKLDQISGTLINSLLSTIPDPTTVADAALNYLSAGRDTTAQALTWTFHLLMTSSPSSLSLIRTEVRSLLLLSSTTQPFHPSLLTPQSLPYTLATFYESLRLRPPIPFEIKQHVGTTPASLPDGTVLPPGAVVVWCPWAMGRSHRTWGPDADVFRPERWIDEKGCVSQPSASKFPVFNGGPRSCLGKKMAEGIAVQTIAVVALMFDVRPAEGEEGERRSKISLTLPMEGGLPVVVAPRRWRWRHGGLVSGLEDGDGE